MDEENTHFRKSEELFTVIQKLFTDEKERILKEDSFVQVEHVGSSAVPGALTLGDLDIQVRVAQGQFKSAVKNLKGLYELNHPELWTDQFALFKKEDQGFSIGIVVTVIDSTVDEFSRLRDLLKNNPELLEKYNNLKKACEGKTLKEYKQAKRDFFGPNGASYLLRSGL